MTVGLVAFGSVLGYIAYMRSKYESQGYYSAVQEDGTEVYRLPLVEALVAECSIFFSGICKTSIEMAII